MPDKLAILGVGINTASRSEVLKQTEDFLQGSTQHFIATVNPEFLVLARKDDKFKRILNLADLAVPDGFGLVIAGWLQQYRLRRFTGVDLLEQLCQIAAQQNKPVFFLGGHADVAKLTAERLGARIPNLQIAGAENGGEINDPQATTSVVARIFASKAALLFVALGHGKQEKWIYHHLDQLPAVKIAMGVGGAFDYLSGTVPRAPMYMRWLGLEWLYRAIQQPWRWRRIVTAVIVFPALYLVSLFQQWTKKS
jgi:N-acetylglucosaminyldiphosphoundecaprenol N-acetyl-beta-D-mannosaminyltransferase